MHRIILIDNLLYFNISEKGLIDLCNILTFTITKKETVDYVNVKTYFSWIIMCVMNCYNKYKVKN